MFKNTGRFFQLGYRLSKLYIEYKIRYDDKDDDLLIVKYDNGYTAAGDIKWGR